MGLDARLKSHSGTVAWPSPRSSDGLVEQCGVEPDVLVAWSDQEPPPRFERKVGHHLWTSIDQVADVDGLEVAGVRTGTTPPGPEEPAGCPIGAVP